MSFELCSIHTFQWSNIYIHVVRLISQTAFDFYRNRRVLYRRWRLIFTGIVSESSGLRGSLCTVATVSEGTLRTFPSTQTCHPLCNSLICTNTLNGKINLSSGYWGWEQLPLEEIPFDLLYRVGAIDCFRKYIMHVLHIHFLLLTLNVRVLHRFRSDGGILRTGHCDKDRWKQSLRLMLSSIVFTNYSV